MRTSDQIAAMMREYGTTHFFFVPVVIPQIVKEMAEVGIVPVMTHGEKAAAYMADGYARASGRVGVCAAQNIGSTNLAAGLRDAYMARSPIIALSGAADARTRHRNLYQDVDDHGAFESMTKSNWQVDDHTRLPDLLRQAYRAASSGAPGPVHLELAGKQGNMGDHDAAGQAYVEARYGSAPSTRGHADPALVAEAAAVLARAARPVIVAGGGVIRSGAGEALLRFARDRSVPVATTLNGMSSIAHDDPLCARTVGDYGSDLANRFLYESDAVLVVGSSLGGMTTKHWTLIHDQALVQIDVDPEEIGRNFRCEVPLVGDARAILGQLAGTERFTAPPAWLDRLAELREEWSRQVEPVETSSAVPMRPERLLTMLTAEISDTAIVVGDTGHAAAWSARHMKLRAGQTMIRAAGSLGWALPAAIGAKCVAPEREVVCFTGDGGYFYHVAELETARRYGVQVIIVVNNNVSLNQEAYLWDTTNPKQDRNWTFYDSDLVAIAEAMGCHAARVDDPADFPAAMKAARASNLPAVIDARTDIGAVSPKSWGPAPVG
jgi:acetolactate synthase-1/2/3 large subunit